MLGTGAIVSIVAVVLTFIISIITFFRKKLFFRQRAKTQKDNHKTNGEERISVKQEVPKIKITDPEELEQKPVSEDQLEEKNDVKTQDEGEESEKDEKEETKFEIETQNDEEENEINESFEIDAKINAPINHKIIENFYGDTVIEKNTQEEEEIKETVQDELEPEKQNEAINPQDSLVEEETISEQETPKEEETQEIQKEEETQEIQKEEEKEIESAVESISPQSEEKETKEEEEPEIEEKQEKPQENLAISVQEFTPKEEQQTQEQKTEEILSPLPEKSPEPEIFHKPENLFIERKKQELNESEIGISPSPILSPALLYLSANSPTTTNEENNSKSSDLSTIPLLDSSPTSSNLDISTNSDTNLRASEDLLSDVPTDTNFDSDDEEVDSDEDRGKEPEITEETEIPEQEDQELIEFRKKEVKRSYILKEFVQTEINYCHQLDNLLKYYAEPLKMGVRSKNNPSGSKLEKIIDTEVAKKIFADVGVIHGINSAFKIQLQLIVNAQGGIKEEQLATLLLKQALSFRLYSSFVTNYKTAAAEIEKERKKNKKFVEFLNQTQDEMRKSGESNFELLSLLITPIQRIPRYRLLMEDLIRSVPETIPKSILESQIEQNLDPETKLKNWNETRSKLKQALELIKEIAGYVNEKQKQMLQLARLAEFQELFNIKSSVLLIPGRVFVFEEEKLCYSKQDGKLHSAHTVLMNDVLIMHKIKVTLGMKSSKNRIIVIKSKKEDRSFNFERIPPSPISKNLNGIKLTVFSGTSKVAFEMTMFSPQIEEWAKHLQEVKDWA